MRWVIVLCLLVLACGPPEGELTGSECPTIDPPTYAGFGSAFFMTYCLECHSITKTGKARNGAPDTIDFDTLSLIRDNTSDIDKQAAFGPKAQNTLMPRGTHAKPTGAERTELGQFIACLVANP